MDLNEIRSEIDKIDDELVRLFCQRMHVSTQIADYKKANNLPIFQPARERVKLQDVAEKAGPEMANYTRVLYSMLFELSRSYQSKRNREFSPLYKSITQAIEHTPKLFPQAPMVACQGVEGAYSQIACEKIFKNPFIMYFKSFEAVFSAIDQGLCQYGILPIENSTAGSVNKVYDLMIEHNFSIVRTFRLKIDHNLLVNPGTNLADIKEVYSHEQAINQCANYLAGLKGVKVTVAENTAMAARMVAQSDRTDVAALSSRFCGEAYGLNLLQTNVQDQDNNYTRFICISKSPEIYPGADRTSLMMTLPHKPGSLYNVLSKFYSLGINLRKLESRPLPDREFEFMFYFDLECSVYAPEMERLFRDLEEESEQFRYLGTYNEVIC